MRITSNLSRSALLYGNELAIRDSDGEWTWREFLDRVKKIAGALQKSGVGKDTPVAILMHNSHKYMEFMYATLWCGGVLVPLNTRLAPPELIFQMNDCEAKILAVDDAFLDMLPGFEGKLDTVDTTLYCGMGDAPEGMDSFDALLERGQAIKDSSGSYDDLMGIFYTGGTTGRAKGVMLTHTSAMTNTANAAIAFGYEQTDTYLHVAPMFHLADAGNTWTMTLAGGTHAFIPGFTPDGTLKAIQDFKITKIVLVPTMINMVVNHPDVNKYDLSSLKSVLYGASPIPAAVLKKAMETLCSCDFVQGYGMTESSQVVSILSAENHRLPEDHEHYGRLKSAGHALPLAEIEVRDDNDDEVAHGTVGEICFRGANVMKGYLNMPEATEEALKGGWMHSGDVGYMDDDGYIYLVDRSKDMIVTGGENVYSVEVEAAIYTHPAVLEAAVIGIPNKEWGEAVHAVVKLKEGESATEEELIAHSKTLIAGFKCPKSIEFSEEDLPKSGAGKILKRDLRVKHWGDAERGIN